MEKQVPEGYRIYRMRDDWFVPEKLDTRRNMWRSFPKGANGYVSHKTWMGAYRFILRHAAASLQRG